MNSENNKSEMDLIAKYLAGEATPEEAMQLDDWLTEPENRKIFEQAQKLYRHMPGSTAEVPSMQNEWMHLHDKMNSRKVSGQKVLRMPVLRYIAAACVVGVIAFISFMLITNTKKDQTDKMELAVFKTSAGNEVRTDTMPDGSTITINKNSSISYTSAFNTINREVQLSGESYFDIVPDNTKPFIITVDDLKIKVVGTSFNVRKIPSDKTIEVQVVKGIVKMYTKEKEITVIKGQTGIYTRHDHALKLKNTLDVNSIGYATKTFSFTDISLTEVCDYLEKAFNVTIKLDAEKFAECRLTAQFKDKTLTYILDVINATLNTTYTQNSNTIYINGNGCQ